MNEHTVNRRLLIAVGASTYRDDAIKDLPGVADDVRRVCALLEPMGYERVLAGLSENPDSRALPEGIEDWALEADLGPHDVVVVYFAGHGTKAADRHYLLCGNTNYGRWTTALASEDLCRPLLTSPVGHLLVMLDTCYAGAGAENVSVLAAELAGAQRRAAGRWLLAAARGKEKAKENAFVDALTDVLRHPRASAHQEFLGVREVTERINAHFRTAHKAAQHASHSAVDSDGYAPFFRNTAHIPGLPWNDLDVETLTRLRKQSRGHFGPRGRGLEHAGQRGDYFTGRTAALNSLASWLRSDRHDRRAKVVTGDPGSGKSALLGRLLMLTEADHPSRSGTPRNALPPPGLAIVPLHARRTTAEELAAELAKVLNLPSTDRDDLLQALGERTEPVTLLVDALDEAGTAGDSSEGMRVARELLQPMTSLSAVRLIIGTRRPVIPALGRAVDVINLDDSEYITQSDITDYARSLLLEAQDPDSRSPYRNRPAQAAMVAKGIAERAGRSFLVARMTARAVVDGRITVDTTRPGWQNALPSDAGQAFAAYLARFGRDREKVERLLRPLAYAQGAGLPWSTHWSAIAEALSGRPCPEEDLHWLHENAGSYVVATGTADTSAFRLFHETMAEHLRTPGHDREAHAAITRALLAQVPHDPRSSGRDWPAASLYIRDHLATHAAAADVLDPLLHDSDFLIHATPGPLTHALPNARSPEGRLRCAIYRASADQHARVTSEARRDILAIDAARYGERSLAAELARGRPWGPRWATGTLVHPALIITLSGHTGPVTAVACTTIDGRPHAITTGKDETVRVWDLTDGTTRTTLPGHTGRVSAVACTTINDRPYAVTSGDDTTVRVWDLANSTQQATLAGHTNWVNAIACTTIDGHPHAITTSSDHTIRVWDLTDGTTRTTLTGHTAWVLAVACTTIDGRPHAITTSADTTVRVWDLTDGTTRTTLTGHTNSVFAVACATIDGRPHVVTTSADTTVRVWDLTNGAQHGTLTGHTNWVNAIACATIDNRPHAVSGSADYTARVWDLTSRTQRILTGHTNWLRAVACTTINDRPHAVTTGDDHTVRVWDLTEQTSVITLTGHTNWVFAVACTSIDGRPHAITGSGDQTVRVWDLTDGTERTLIGHTNWVNAVACTTVHDRPHAVTGSADYTVRVWDLAHDTPHAILTGHTAPVRAVACATIDNRPHAVTGSADHTVRVWDLTDGTALATLTGHTNSVRAVACATIDNRPHAISTSADHTMRIWDLTGNRLTAALALPLPADAVAALGRDIVIGMRNEVVVLTRRH
ncbi:caspase family protein [Streptomyces sp. NPDC019443]|uniref:caspase family protein n=1 Tax=Streptomyces sp. NPDC019443 TaxID=3365061 RepID=UPI0037B95FE1